LLAAIPADLPALRRRWAVWAGVAGVGVAVAAACLLAVLAWPRRDDGNPDSRPDPRELVHPATPQSPDDRIAARRDSRRLLDEAEPAPFHWPLPEPLPTRLSTTIPADLFD
jgi:hypothetical protein